MPGAAPSHSDELPLGKKDVILRPIVQMGKWSLRAVPNTWKESSSASPGGTPSLGPRQLSWDGRGCYSNLTPSNIKQQQPCAICWKKDVIGKLRDVQYGPVLEGRTI